MSASDSHQDTNPSPPARRHIPRRSLLAGVVVAVLVTGAAAGAGGVKLAQRREPQDVMLLQPIAIGKLQGGNPAATSGKSTAGRCSPPPLGAPPPLAD